PEAVQHIETLASLPGVDVLFVGLGDLTIGLGKNGVADDPEVKGILRRGVEACNKHGKLAGIPCIPERVANYRELGFRFFNVFSDYRGIFNGARHALAAAKP
ncbi:MAG: hypothetical protein ACREH8_23680, partial [Opitutaceae bacterium]